MGETGTAGVSVCVRLITFMYGRCVCGLTAVLPGSGGRPDADGGLLRGGVGVVGGVQAAEGQPQVLLRGVQAQVLGVEVDQGAQQGWGAVLPQHLAAPQALLLHTAPAGA